ncbi:MAG: hypothetical protein ACRD0K_19070 [Egibacteraceae bacterium]
MASPAQKAAVDPAEHALSGLEDLLGLADDSPGCLGGLLRDAQALRLTACAEAVRSGALDPVELAEHTEVWETSLISGSASQPADRQIA